MPTRLSASGRVSRPFSSDRQRLGIGLRLADLLRDGVGIVGQVDARIVRCIRLRHLLGAVAQRHHPCRGAGDQRLRQRKEQAVGKAMAADRVAEIIVELLRDVARQLQMLLLVLADRYVGGAIQQNVGRHQHRIVVKTDRGILAILAGLFLELRHPAQPADPRDAIEDPGQLRMSGDLALVEHDVLLRIDAGGDEGRGDLAGVAARVRRGRPRHRRLA